MALFAPPMKKNATGKRKSQMTMTAAQRTNP